MALPAVTASVAVKVWGGALENDDDDELMDDDDLLTEEDRQRPSVPSELLSQFNIALCTVTNAYEQRIACDRWRLCRIHAIISTTF